MSSSFSDKEVTEFVHFLKGNASLPVKEAALIVGCQPGSCTWVFNAGIQIDGNGAIIPHDGNEYMHVWLNHNTSDERTKVPLGDLSPKIKTPVLANLKEVLQKMLLHLRHPNIFSAVSMEVVFPASPGPIASGKGQPPYCAVMCW